ncbi:ChrR family anti-sigma-E factor [Colwellia asteriadis]|uniref:ChrR family anti-sigma-E factor n=1 Tax=Colwellia asteriadis TaxID=517723 RepID=A0ABN1L4L1_9GAMM
MIKHHPTFELLQNFVNGDLPASLAAGIAIHADMCPICQQHITQLTEQVAELNFEQEFLDKFIVDDAQDLLELADFDQMIDSITATNDIVTTKVTPEKSITFRNNEYKLPRALNNIEQGKPAHIGKLTRTRLQLDEGNIRTSLLHIDPGGSVPEHTHNGFELTLLLAGSFSDVQGEYVAGDFIMLDGNHQHHPVSEKGCLCYTVANAPLHFTQGINKLLNPIGTFIY